MIKDQEFINAVKSNNIELVKTFLVQGIDPSVNDNIAIASSAYNGFTEIVELLLRDPRVDPNKHNSLGLAAQNGHTETVRLLLNDQRNDPSRRGNEAIIDAVKNGHIEVVRLLLSNPRVDPTARNNLAIIYAARNGHTEIVRLLLTDPRVDPTVKDNEAIKTALKNNHLDIAKLLLQDGRTDWRIVEQHPVIKQILTDQNIDIEKKLAQSYLSFSKSGPKTIVDKKKEVSTIPKKIRINVVEWGVYQGFYEEYCSNIPAHMKIPPMKLILIADKLKIDYDRYNIDWSELCTKVRIRLNQILD